MMKKILVLFLSMFALCQNNAFAASVTPKSAYQPEMIQIPRGSYRMGSDEKATNEKPIHQVTIDYDFVVGKYEVTQAQWLAVMGSNPSTFLGSNNPVENVSWDDIQDFLRKLNGTLGLSGRDRVRLLTEAEWEYAARADTSSKYACGNSEGCLDSAAWYRSNSGEKTHSVGQKRANPWGLHDMHGNVWEWVEDCWNNGYDNASVSGAANIGGNCSHHILRGGSWNNPAWSLRSAARDRSTSSNRLSVHGFRVARTLLGE